MGCRDWRVDGETTAQPVISAKTNLVAVAGTDPDGKQASWVGRWPEFKQSKIFRGHSLESTALAFSSDGKTLASGSKDTTVLLWDTSTILD
ncbi:MAG: WD40 domain-containing protein [Planctomycetes bacterium]|nr:WD40 domain-containing protein [Planctomycetota bacterium]